MRLARVKQNFAPRLVPECECPEESLKMVDATIVRVFDKLRECSTVEVRCCDCGAVYRVTVGDCLTLGYRKRIGVH